MMDPLMGSMMSGMNGITQSQSAGAPAQEGGVREKAALEAGEIIPGLSLSNGGVGLTLPRA
jgi:hypothetical protein